MPESEQVFSEEYQTGTKTASASDEVVLPVSDTITSTLEIEVNRYGISKPKRIIIRAEIIHD